MAIPLCLLAILGYQFVLHLNTAFANWPETTFFPWVISKGFLPYRDFFDIHNPAVYYLNGLIFHWFGVNLQYLRWEMAVVMVGNTIGVFYLTKRIFDAGRGVVAASCFVCLELQLFGNGIWFEQFVLLFLLTAASYLVGHYHDGFTHRQCAILGLICGMGALFKQTVVWVFFGATGLILVWSLILLAPPLKQVSTKILLLGLAALAPLVLHLLVLIFLGAAEPYLYSAVYLPLFDYSYFRAPGTSFILRLFLWLLLAVGFLFLNSRAESENPKIFNVWVVFVFFATSLLFDYPTHGRIHLIPAAAFLSIMAADLTFRCYRQPSWIGLLLVPFLIWTTVDHINFLISNPGQTYKFNRLEGDRLVNWIRRNTDPEERIYVTQDLLFYVHAQRIPATTNVYDYPWLMHGRYGVKSIIRDLQQREPRFVIMRKEEMEDAFPTSPQIKPLYRYIFSRYHAFPMSLGEMVVLQKNPNHADRRQKLE